MFLAWVLFWFGCLLSLSSVCAGHYPIDRGWAGSWPVCTPGKVERVVGTQHQYLPLESEMPVVAVLDPHAGGALLPKSAQRKMLLWRACPSPCITPNNGVLHLWQVQASSWTPLVWANHTLDILTVFIQSTLMLSSGSDSQSPRIGIQPRPLQWMSL